MIHLLSFSALQEQLICTAHLDSRPCICRYWHADAVTSVAFSRTSLQLASGSASELGVWSPVTKTVTKQKVMGASCRCAWSQYVHRAAVNMRQCVCGKLPKVRSKVTCLEWSPSGSVLAAAHEDGCISLRGAAALPTGQIVRHPCAVTLTWRPCRCFFFYLGPLHTAQT